MKLAIILACGSVLLWAVCARAAEPPPNIVLIFVDDLGYGDLGCFGSTKHRTPNIDRLAAEGTRFTSFYTIGSVCTPSRAALMTGSYAHRVNMHCNTADDFGVLLVGEAKGLHPDEVTLAEVLKQRGYATACIGKWHLGDQPSFLPTRQGFDEYFGIPYSNDMGREVRPMYKGNPKFHYPPLPLMRGETVVETEPDQKELTRRYTEEAVAFITKNKDRPFFVYLPHAMPHWPHYAGDSFRGKSANSIYGDCVEELDWSTGTILQTLKNLGLDDKTLVLFTSDNGAQIMDGGSNLPLGGAKGWVHEGGMRVPLLARWPGKVPAGRTSDEIVTAMDMLPTFARLAGVNPPTDRVIDGKDITPLLLGEAGAKSPHEAFYYFMRDQMMAVRAGPWKLVVARQYGKPLPKPLLYNLARDIAETTDVAADHPQVAQRMAALIEQGRATLGDKGQPPPHTRPAGRVENPMTLTRDETKP